MKKILLLVSLVLLFSGCSNNSKEQTLEELMKENEYIIIDVRTEEEYREGHIVGAINIPYDEIENSSVLDKEKNIFVYCRSGARSKIAFNSLKNLGYTVYDLGAFKEIDLPKE